VKNNQQELYKALEDTFRFQCAKERVSSHELDFGHGRIENRTCYTSQNIENIDTTKWRNVKTLIKVVSERYDKTNHKAEEPAIRYYISSIEQEPVFFNTNIRATSDFKEEVVRLVMEKHLPLPQVVLQCGVSKTTLESWVRMVKANGYATLYQ
jgi:hypothetical protein